MKHLYPILAVLAAVAIAFFAGRGCEREPELPSETLRPAPEKQRESIITGRDKKNEKLAADTLKYLTQLEAHIRTISRLMANGKQKDRELAALYAKYAKKPTLAGCDTLVREQKSRIDSLKQEVATRRLDSLNKETMLKVYAEHLFDKDLRIDSLNTIAKDAHKKLAKKPMKVYATSAFETSPINNNLKIGGTVTYKRFLGSYQKGIIQNTHELKTGVLLW